MWSMHVSPYCRIFNSVNKHLCYIAMTKTKLSKQLKSIQNIVYHIHTYTQTGPRILIFTSFWEERLMDNSVSEFCILFFQIISFKLYKMVTYYFPTDQ